MRSSGNGIISQSPISEEDEDNERGTIFGINRIRPIQLGRRVTLDSATELNTDNTIPFSVVYNNKARVGASTKKEGGNGISTMDVLVSNGEDSIENTNGCTIPRYLLRQKLMGSVNKDKEYGDIWNNYSDFLSSFTENREGILSNIQILSDMIEKDYCRYTDEFFGFDKVMIEHIHSLLLMTADGKKSEAGSSVNESGDSPKNYTILLTVIGRLCLGHKLLDMFEEKDDQRYRFCSQLFIDTHIDMCIAMCRLKMFTDEDVEKSGIIEASFPYDNRFYYWGDLPDLSPSIYIGNIWYDISPKYKTLICLLIHLFMSKSQGHKCQLRNFILITWKYSRQYPAILRLFKRILEIHLLGNYPHCKYRPRFSRRMYTCLNFPLDDMDEEHLILWAKENQEIIYIAMKEYYMAILSTEYCLNNVLSSGGGWVEIRNTILMGADMIRSRLCNTPLETMYVFQDISKQLHIIHLQQLPHIFKLKKSGFDRKMLNEMEKYYNTSVINKFSIDIDGNESIVGETKLKAMDTIVSRLSEFEDGRIEMIWIKCLGVSMDNYEIMCTLYNEYETDIVADNAMPRYIERIYKNDQVDFHIIRILFKKLCEVRSSASFPMSYRTALRQSNALSNKCMVFPWEVKDPRSCRFSYCTICNKWAHPLVEMISLNNIVSKTNNNSNNTNSNFMEENSFVKDYIEGKNEDGNKTTENNGNNNNKKKGKDKNNNSSVGAANNNSIKKGRRTKKRRKNNQFPITTSTMDNIYSMGLDQALYNPQDGKIYCGMGTTSTNIKRLKESGKFFSKENVDAVRDARAIRKHKYFMKCRTTPLSNISMIGRYSILGKKAYTLCEICGTNAQFQGAKVSKTGFSCLSHGEAKITDISMSSTIHKTAKDCLWDARAKKFGYKPCCEYCGITGDSIRSPLVPITICEDEYDPKHKNSQYTFKDCFLCQDDANRVCSGTDQRRVYKRTDLVKAIHDARVHGYAAMKSEM